MSGGSDRPDQWSEEWRRPRPAGEQGAGPTEHPTEQLDEGVAQRSDDPTRRLEQLMSDWDDQPTQAHPAARPAALPEPQPPVASGYYGDPEPYRPRPYPAAAQEGTPVPPEPAGGIPGLDAMMAQQERAGINDTAPLWRAPAGGGDEPYGAASAAAPGQAGDPTVHAATDGAWTGGWPDERPARSRALPVFIIGLAVGALAFLLFTQLGGGDDPKRPGEVVVTVTKKPSGSTSEEPSPTEGTKAAGQPPQGSTRCGGSGGDGGPDQAAVGPNTTCAFGREVLQAYQDEGGEGRTKLRVRSPVTRRTYTMMCAPADGGVVTCRGGNNATVYLY